MPAPSPSLAQETVEADDKTAAAKTTATKTDAATAVPSGLADQIAGAAGVGENIEYPFIRNHVDEHPMFFIEVRGWMKIYLS